MCVCIYELYLFLGHLVHFKGFNYFLGRIRAFLFEATRGHPFAELMCANHRAVPGGGTEEGKVTWVSPT